MKKSLKWGLGAGVLVLLVGAGIASQQAKKTATTSVETAKKEPSQADKDSYEKALAAIKKAEESLSDTDVATAEKLVKEATYRQSILKGMLKDVQDSLPWRELKNLIATAQASPTDETIGAAHKKLDELTSDAVASQSSQKEDYTKQVYALYLKKVEVAVAQAESTTTADDVNHAISLWTTTDPYPSNWGKSGFDSDLYLYINELRGVLSARISAIQVGSKVAVATAQEQVQESVQAQDGASESGYTEVVQDSGQSYTSGQTYTGEQKYTQPMPTAEEASAARQALIGDDFIDIPTEVVR